MNFIITTRCSKGCPYCFAAKSRKDLGVQDMNLEDFKYFLDIDGNHDVIKLLGGEPTNHPQFKEFIKEIIKRKKEIVLISNFLFNDDITDFIVENMYMASWKFLVNSTDLDTNNRIEQWSKNYNKIYSTMYSLNREEQITCGITLQINKGWKYYVNYIDFLIKNSLKIERMRLSLEFPGDDKNNFWFINNKDVGELLLIITKRCIDSYITTAIDCAIYPCVFKSKEEYKIVKKFAMPNFKHRCNTGDSKPPADLFPDKTLAFCYPLKDSISVDTVKYDNLNSSLLELELKYSEIEKRIKNELPKSCEICSFYKDKICVGPCLGFYKITL